MDIPPDIVTVVITRADGGLTVKRIIAAEYREPTDDEKNGIRREGDNILSVPLITTKVQTIRRDITPEFIEAELAKRPYVFANHLGWEIVPNDYLDEDTDDTFRNAWVHKPGGRKPDHDMPKAREIHRVYLRKARLAEFCRLDNDYRIADEANDMPAKQKIGKERQAFRDVTEDPRIEAAQTVEELKALRLDAMLPEITKGENFMKEKMKISPAIPGVAGGK